MPKPIITLKLIDKKGPRGCNRGHKIGDCFDFEQDRGRLCPVALSTAMRYIDVLKHGGSYPRRTPGTAAFCCPDPEVINIFEITLQSADDIKVKQI